MKNIIVAVSMCLLVLVFASSSALAQCGGCGISNYSSSYGQANSRAPYGFVKAPAYGSSCCGGSQTYAGTGRGSSSSLPPCCQTGPGAVSSNTYKGYGRGQVANQSSLPPCCQTGAGVKPSTAYSPRGPIRREVVQVTYRGARSAVPKPVASQRVARQEVPSLPNFGVGPGQAAAEFTRQAIGSRPVRSLWTLLDGSSQRNRPTVVRQASARPVEQSSVAKVLSWNPQWTRPASAPARFASSQPSNPTNSTLPPCCAAKAQR